jgi:hypothetical protein
MYRANLVQAAPRNDYLGDDLVGRLCRSVSLKQHGKGNNQQDK